MKNIKNITNRPQKAWAGLASARLLCWRWYVQRQGVQVNEINSSPS
ncbi:MAG: hypothetical protein ACI9D5_001637 [Candidatus Endobugula sp.]|jgi:hypothetical protein